jgi:hypothetical protein
VNRTNPHARHWYSSLGSAAQHDARRVTNRAPFREGRRVRRWLVRHGSGPRAHGTVFRTAGSPRAGRRDPVCSHQLPFSRAAVHDSPADVEHVGQHVGGDVRSRAHGETEPEPVFEQAGLDSFACMWNLNGHREYARNWSSCTRRESSGPRPPRPDSNLLPRELT